MTDEALAPPPSKAPVSLRPPVSLPPTKLEAIGLRPNAIWLREMRQQLRLPRTPFSLFAITLLFALFMCSVGGLSASSRADLASLGEIIFQTYFSVAQFLVLAIGPSIAASSIAAEREGRTYEALLLTGLTPKEIVHGKFFSAMTMISLYIVFVAPIGAVGFVFGGVTTVEVLLAFVFLLGFAALSVMFGLALSSVTQSQRGAIVATLLLALLLGLPLYFMILGLGIPVHTLWHVVPNSVPIWLPLALCRAPFGIDYVAILVFVPLAAFVIPFWFLYNTAVGNLMSPTEDRSSAHRLWLLASSALLLVVGLILVRSVPTGNEFATAAFCTLFAFVFFFFCTFVFAGEPGGPSRRVRYQWAKGDVAKWRTWLKPSLLGAQMNTVLLYLVCSVPVLLLGYALGGSATPSRDVSGVMVAFVFLSPFLILSSGLNALFRARGGTAWRARLSAFFVLFLISIVPWVIVAIGGIASHGSKDVLVIGSPSPFFVFPLVEAASRSGSSTQGLFVGAGLIVSFVWTFLGISFLVSAHGKTRAAEQQEEDRFDQEEAFLRKEDEASMASAPHAGSASAG